MDTRQGAAMDAVCVGETMALLVPDPPAPPEEAATFRREIGGAESNVAVHLARSGLRVAWHSVLGDDGFGRYVRERMRSEGVECVARVDALRPTGLYFKELGVEGTRVRYYRQGSAASTLDLRDAEQVWRQHPRLLHTSGITAVLSDSCQALVTDLLTAVRPGTLRSFDVNYRPALHNSHNADIVRDLAKRADVVFCGLDEAQALWGAGSVDEVCELLTGPDILVIKQGSGGATACRSGKRWFQPAPAINVVETVGAGDAFAAGFLQRLLDHAPVDECLREGARLAGTVLQVHGDLTPQLHKQGRADHAHGTGDNGGTGVFDARVNRRE